MKKLLSLVAAVTMLCRFSLVYAEDEFLEDPIDEVVDEYTDPTYDDYSGGFDEEILNEDIYNEDVLDEDIINEDIPKNENWDGENEKESTASELTELFKALLTSLKDELSSKKIEVDNYKNQIKALFKDGSEEIKKLVLEQLAELKKAAGDLSIGTFVDGIDVDYSKYDNVLPFIKNGTTLIPVRAVTETFNSKVTWNPDDRTVTIKSGDTEIILTIDNIKANVNGEEKQLAVAPEIVDGHTLVPVRFIAEALGLNVSWDDASRTIIIE